MPGTRPSALQADRRRLVPFARDDTGADTLKEWLALGAVAVRDGLARVWGKLATTMAVLGLVTRLVQGGEVLDPGQLQASYDLGASTPGAVWVSAYNSYSGVSGYFSGTIIGVQKDASGNTMYTYIATVNHDWDYPGISITGMGTSNVWTQNGLTFSNLTPVYVSPLWNPHSPNANAGDISIWRSTTAVPDSWVHPLATSLSLGATVTSIGYGDPSTPNGSLTPTGNPMGVNSVSTMAVAVNIQYGNYFGGGMWGSGVPVEGAGNNSDSGAMALINGQLVGMAVAATGGPTDLVRETVFENWTAPDFYNQLAPYAGIHIVGQPTLLSQTSGTNLVLTWVGPYTLQSSTNAAGPYSDIPGSTSPYTNSMTLPEAFFRLRATNAAPAGMSLSIQAAPADANTSKTKEVATPL